MATELADLCRQLRLVHVMDYVLVQQNEEIRSIVEQILSAELDGRRRAKLGKLVQQAGFPHIKTFDGMSMTISLFRTAAVQRKPIWSPCFRRNLWRVCLADFGIS